MSGHFARRSRGIGDDDTVGVLVVSEHSNGVDARAWIEEELRARFPESVARRRHGAVGASLFGHIERGFYVEDLAEGVVSSRTSINRTETPICRGVAAVKANPGMITSPNCMAGPIVEVARP